MGVIRSLVGLFDSGILGGGKESERVLRRKSLRNRICRIEEIESRELLSATHYAPPDLINVGAVYHEDYLAASQQNNAEDTLGDTFIVSWNGGAAGTTLKQITIQLNQRDGEILYFNTDPNDPQADNGEAFPFTVAGDSDITQCHFTLSQDKRSLTIIFDEDFTADKVFKFKIDVNLINTKQGQQLNDIGALVNGYHLENSTIDATFTSDNYEDLSVNGTFQDTYIDENGTDLKVPPDNYDAANTSAAFTAGVLKTAETRQDPKKGSLSGYVYEDINNDGIFDQSESGIAGVQLELFVLDENGYYVSTNLIETTDQNGYYKFDNIAGGRTYRIVESQPTGFGDGKDTVGTSGGEIERPDTIKNIHLWANEHGEKYNFGELKNGTISGYVYHDINNNGTREANETGIAGVKIQLQKFVNGNYQNISEADGGVVTTDSDGSYIFNNLTPNETYRVVELPLDDTSWRDGKEEIGSLGGNILENDKIGGIYLEYGRAGTEYNFGEIKPASIKGNVYEDNNNNGQKDNNESGIANVELQLYKLNNNTWAYVKKTTTDANGDYAFDDLEAGETYLVREIEPTGYIDGTNTVGTINGQERGTLTAAHNDNDQIESILLNSDEHGINYNFAELKKGSISGYVYNDTNYNSQKDSNESGIQNVTLTLSVWNGTTYENLATTTTDSNGFYKFDNLDPLKKYQITESQPTNYIDGNETIGTINGAIIGILPNNDIINEIDLPVGGIGVNYNFAEIEKSSISGYVYHDINNNGIRESGEEGIPNVRLKLQKLVNGVYQDVPTAEGGIATTDSDGYYSFAGLDPRETYAVVESQPDDTSWLDGKEEVGNFGGDKNENDIIKNIRIPAGQHGINYNFGELKNTTISGNVYEDKNNNGEKDPDETGLEGVTIYLCVIDENGDKVNIAQTVTDADGHYSFENLEPGKTYCVTEIEPDRSEFCDGINSVGTVNNTEKGELTETKDGNDQIQNIHLNSGDNGINYNFAENRKGSISGYVYNDTNNNGKKDNNESGIQNVTLSLWVWNGTEYINTSKTTLTNSNGYYEFDSLCPFKKYQIRETQPTNYTDSTESIGTINNIITGSLGGNDIITDIELPPSGKGLNYNFAEITKIDPPDPNNPDPNNPDPNPPTPTDPQVPFIPSTAFPYIQPAGGLGVGYAGASPFWQPPVTNSSLLTGYGSGALPAAVDSSWHLSVINAGYPRDVEGAEAVAEGLAAANEAAQQTMILRGATTESDGTTTSSGRYVSVAWEPAPMNKATWYVRDKNGTIKKRFNFGLNGGVPVVGDFNGDGISDVAVFHEGRWYIDLNGNGEWDAGDLWAELGTGLDQPIVGDWDGDGKSDIGVFGATWTGDSEIAATEPGLPSGLNTTETSLARPKNIPPSVSVASEPQNRRAMKHSQNGAVRIDVIDHVFKYGESGDQAFTGDFAGDGIKKIGVYRNGTWYIDYDGNGKFDDRDIKQTVGGEFGADAIAVVGDWDGDGIDNIGLYVNGIWHLDTTGDFKFDTEVKFGEIGDKPVVGDFSGSGIDELAVYRVNQLDSTVAKAEVDDPNPVVASQVDPEAEARTERTPYTDTPLHRHHHNRHNR